MEKKIYETYIWCTINTKFIKYIGNNTYNKKFKITLKMKELQSTLEKQVVGKMKRNLFKYALILRQNLDL